MAIHHKLVELVVSNGHNLVYHLVLIYEPTMAIPPMAVMVVVIIVVSPLRPMADIMELVFLLKHFAAMVIIQPLEDSKPLRPITDHKAILSPVPFSPPVGTSNIHMIGQPSKTCKIK